MIKLENIKYSYDSEHFVIDELNVQIKPGQITMIIGKNGSGKSTLANLIAHITKTSKGYCSVDDIVYNKKNTFSIRQKVGIVFQNPDSQIVFNKVYDDIKFTLSNYHVPKEQIDTIIKQSLSKVNMLDYIEANPYQLSSGQKQRVVLASVLAIDPEYIVFDEATAFLDTEGKNTFYSIIQELANQGKGIIFISNNLDEMIIADTILLLKKGTIVEKIPRDQIINSFDILIKHGFKIPLVLEIIKHFHIDLAKNKYSIDNIVEIVKQNE